MRIEHIAIWCRDLERLSDFYREYFGAKPGNRYVNTVKGFESVFLNLDSGPRMELMRSQSISGANRTSDEQSIGLAHLAISVGSEQGVDELTTTLKHSGVAVIDGPRRTGDGYYESVVLDPENNRIEITV